MVVDDIYICVMYVRYVCQGMLMVMVYVGEGDGCVVNICGCVYGLFVCFLDLRVEEI